MDEWTLEDIERQAARGGVNRQQAEQLVAEIRRLRDERKRYRVALAEFLWVIHRDPRRRLAANLLAAMRDARRLLEGDTDG